MLLLESMKREAEETWEPIGLGEPAPQLALIDPLRPTLGAYPLDSDNGEDG